MIAALLSAALAAAPGSYGALQINPKLPPPDGERAATKILLFFSDDDAVTYGMGYTIRALEKTRGPATAYSLSFYEKRNRGGPRAVMLPDARLAQTVDVPLAEGLTGVQSNNPLYLAKILGYGFSHYPSKRRYIDLNGHGGGVTGVGTDDDRTDAAGNPLKKSSLVLSIEGFAKALRTASPDRPIDAVLFRACFMGNVEALYELTGAVRYAVASQDEVHGGVDLLMKVPVAFDRMVREDVDPKVVAKALAAQLMPARMKAKDHCNRTECNYNVSSDSVVAIDIAKMADLTRASSELADALVVALSGPSKQAVIDVYDTAPRASYTRQMGDYWMFTGDLLAKVKDPAVLSAARKVRAAQQAAMLYEKDKLGEANGLSIFLPARGQMPRFFDKGYKQSKFGKDSHWPAFLRAIVADRTPVSQVAPKARPGKPLPKESTATRLAPRPLQ
jgi:hypothetical protein